jgi:tRNA A-37 threonylcarbamoyl transferase component Bud32
MSRAGENPSAESQRDELSCLTCPTCGKAIEARASREFGCMFCLFRAALDAPAIPAADDVATERFGVYEILRREDGSACEIGRGGMGITYRALDSTLRRTVALKLIRNDPALQGDEARQRFMREARVAATLRHPNVAAVYHFGIQEESGQCYYAMEFVEGETLEERVRRCGPKSADEVQEIESQVTDALAAVEARGLVHRDLKPANIMLLEEQERRSVKIIDVGVATALAETADPELLTRDSFVGTPAFASP